MNLRSDILLTIIDSIHIRLPNEKNLPESIDIGLNFISRRNIQLVPNLVRINYDDQKNKDLSDQKIFTKL